MRNIQTIKLQIVLYRDEIMKHHIHVQCVCPIAISVL